MNSIVVTDALPLAAVVAAVSVPFLLERYLLQKRAGIFQLLFWIFVSQISAIGLGMAIVAGFGAESTLGRIGQALGGIGFIAIGAVPFIFLPLALVVAAARQGWCWISASRGWMRQGRVRGLENDA